MRRLLALAGALWLAGCGAPEREWPAPAPALWEVSDASGTRGWLFGTIHALPDGVEWRTPAIDRAVADADLLMVEIGNLGDRNEAAEAFERYAHSSPLAPLSRRVARAERPALAELMQRADMDDADFRDTETWAAALQLASAVRRHDSANGVDRALMADGKSTQALETYDVQFARFDRLDAAAQGELLAGIAHEALGDTADRNLLAWLTGDLAVLERQVGRGILAYPAVREALLVERNAFYVHRITGLMRAGQQPFVAVGAAHMLGEEGLPALFARAGFTVRRIQ